MAKIVYLLILAFITAAIGLYCILPPPIGLNVTGGAASIIKNKWIVLPIVIFITLMLMRYATPPAIQENLKRQFKIFENKHTWVMTIIYVMTFGSFIGYAASAPLSIKVVFGFQHIPDAMGVMTHSMKNPDGPSALSYAWMGPFIGALIRPVGGWFSDKLGGARVTHYVSIVMILAALGVAYFMKAAYVSATPQDQFPAFMILFVILFAATGVGNGSTFRTISMVFDEEQAGPVLGFTSAVAAYGAFIIPKVFGEQIKAATPEYALYGFSIFYAVCLALNWWFYLGPKRDYDNP
jgi:NNP family nitrate/nitrite transporter-like MFS transporter